MIRADASKRMGVGHLMRCMTLGEALSKRGAAVRFVCRAHAGNLIDSVRERGFGVEVLSEPMTAAGDSEDYAQWLGVSQRADAEETIVALGDWCIDWLIVDHYGLDCAWESLMRPRVGRLMVIDDLPQRPHDCELLLNQSETRRAAADYVGQVPLGCRVAIGPRYALLHPEFARQRELLAPHMAPPKRVLVFFGGSDPLNLTGQCLEALSAAEFSALAVDVVVGANYECRKALEAAVARRRYTRLCAAQPHLAGLLATSDIAVGAGGATTWERLCLGVPSIVVSVAENQRPGCEALAAQGLIYYCGTAEGVSAADLAVALRSCLLEPKRMSDMAAGGQALVDGLGASRITEYLMPTRVDRLRVRAARANDMNLYFDWVNDPEVRRQSVETRPVSLQRHREWFAAKLVAPDSRLFVLLADNLPVGQIRFDFEGAAASIDYSVDNLFRGRGWGRVLVTLGMRAIQGCTVFRADVKADNMASRAVFAQLGFSEVVSGRADDLRTFTLGDC